MKKWYRLTSLFALAAAVALAFGCSEDPEPEIDSGDFAGGDFIIERGNLNFNFERTQEIVFIPVQSNIPEEKWFIKAADDAPWCKISRSYNNEKGLQLAVEESEETEIRSAALKVGAGNKEYTINVRQLGYGPAILVNDLSIGAEGGDINLDVTANIDYIVGRPMLNEVDEAEWIERSDAPVTRAFAQKGYGFHAQANMLPFTRKAVVAITAADPMYFDSSVECQIVQGTKTVAIEGLPEGEKVKAESAYCSQSHSNAGADKLIDGITTSGGYHSPWETDNPTTEFPVDWEFTFAGENRIDYFRLYSGTGNGRIGKFDVFYQLEGESGYTKMVDPLDPSTGDELNPLFDFSKRGGVQTCNFTTPLVNVEKLMVRIYNGAGDNKSGRKDMFDPSVSEGFAAAYEIEFYPDISASCKDLILSVFTDLSCSELKADVTRSDITALFGMVPYLAQYVAVPMMEGTYSNDYDRQFRIATYKPYSDISLNTKLLTKKYSRMDNPTGIEVKRGDKLLVCVDKIPAGQTVTLAVYGEESNGYGPNYGSNGSRETVDQEVQLTAGYNAINITGSGMCYIMNTAKNLSAKSESIKVHIAAPSGTVQGYFDIERHTDADYMEILSRTSYKYFVAKGRNMIFNFHTAKLREIAPSGITSGLSAWDDIEGWQKELMGIDKLEWFNNHTMAVSSSNPDVYMNASERRVQFGLDNALYKIISREKLLEVEDNTWGPAHELGHVNQGAINWKSTTESSNNLFSNYAIYKMGKYGSRGESITYLADCFANAEPWAIMGSGSYKGEDTEIHMRLNWQLWNYFHRCGFMPDFFPKLFGMLREDPLPSEYASYFGMSENAGASQLKYAEKVCEAAQMDLTEFFEVWGFYRTIDMSYEQYGTVNYKVTEEMIAESKARIAAMKLPKAPAIQYIEDRQVKNGVTYANLGYYTTYQNKTAITKSPKYSVSGRTYMVSDCDQAVAIEVRRTSGSGLGELLYFSNMTSFTIPASVPQNGIVLYAVQYDGERKPVTVN